MMLAPVSVRSAEDPGTARAATSWRARSARSAASSTTASAEQPDRLRRAPAGVVGVDQRVDERATRPAVTETAPATSKWRAPSVRDSGSSREAMSAAATPIGTLTNSTHSQPAHSVSMPPSSTPAAPPEPATAPQTPSALLRSAPSVEGRGDDRQRGRREQRGAEALDGAGGDQPAVRLREAAGERGDGEQHEAGDEHPPAAEQVGEATAEQQEAAERERVGVDDPRQVVAGRSRSAVPIDGSATLTIEASRTTTNCAAARRTSASQRRSWVEDMERPLGRKWRWSSGSTWHDTELKFRLSSPTVDA